jgi:hypothetical protein
MAFSTHSRPVDPVDHRDGSHHSRSSASALKYHRFEKHPKTRAKLGDKVIWDGLASSFRKYEQLVEGHLMQVGADYLVNQNFLSKYSATSRGEYFYTEEFYSLYGISVPQAKLDRSYLYGLLTTTNRNKENKILLKERSSMDGMYAWAKFKLMYANHASKKLRIENLEDLVVKAYNQKLHESMPLYIDIFQSNMAELEALASEDWLESKKKRQLLRNLREPFRLPTLSNTVGMITAWTMT